MLSLCHVQSPADRVLAALPEHAFQCESPSGTLICICSVPDCGVCEVPLGSAVLPGSEGSEPHTRLPPALILCPFHTANNACAWLPASSAPLWLWPAAPAPATVHPASSGAKPACRSSSKNPSSWIPAFCPRYQQRGKD